MQSQGIFTPVITPKKPMRCKEISNDFAMEKGFKNRPRRTGSTHSGADSEY